MFLAIANKSKILKILGRLVWQYMIQQKQFLSSNSLIKLIKILIKVIKTGILKISAALLKAQDLSNRT